jgi:serine/threonine-protein kinase ULK/ATG1
VKLIDVKKTKNNLYLFMEYCEDGTLSDLINAKKALPEAEALAIFSQIVKGMKILDTCKVVHRDLKPANILINKGIVKIADFGLAKVSKKN